MVNPLDLQRPDELEGIAAEAYLHAQTISPQEKRNYDYVGRSDYSTEAIPSFQERVDDVIIDGGRGQRLLDVGGGDASFAAEALRRHPELTAATLSASDLRTDQSGDDTLYTVGDADRITEIYTPNSFDVIVSAVTTQHIKDNLRLLAGMYEILKPDGVMILDAVFPNISGRLIDIVRHLQQQGHEVRGEGVRSIRSFEMRKSDLPLKLPLEYRQPHEGGGAANSIWYTLSS